MNTDIYRGDLVRLAAIDLEESAAAISRFSRDSEYYRLMDSYPCRLFTKEGTKKWIEKELENEHVIVFAIRTLTDDRLIGDVGLDGLFWNHGETSSGSALATASFGARVMAAMR